MTTYKRLSPSTTRKGSKRPVAGMAQGALKAIDQYDGPLDYWFGKGSTKALEDYQVAEFGEADGEMGRITWTALLTDARAAGWEPAILDQVWEVIAFYEQSNRRDVFGGTSKIDDGAGVNYGLLQHNRHGSLVKLLKRSGRADLAEIYKAQGHEVRIPEIAEWMGSVAGIKAQWAYFEDIVLKLARKELDKLPSLKRGAWCEDRLLLFACDCITQNGTIVSPNRRPVWYDVSEDELYVGAEWNALLPEVPHECVRATFKKWEAVHGSSKGEEREACGWDALNECLGMVHDPLQQMILMAQWRARSSRPKYWRDVESRRMLDATGRGRVHGSKLDLVQDFGFAPQPVEE